MPAFAADGRTGARPSGGRLKGQVCSAPAAPAPGPQALGKQPGFAPWRRPHVVCGGHRGEQSTRGIAGFESRRRSRNVGEFL